MATASQDTSETVISDSPASTESHVKVVNTDKLEINDDDVTVHNCDVTATSEADIDSVLSRQRSEIERELLQLQRTERPVSSRQEVAAQLFSSVIGDASSNDSSSLRPEQVLVEVNALVERRPVTSLLQTGFRQSIERSLRHAVRSVRRYGNNSNQVQQLQQHQPRAESASSSSSALSADHHVGVSENGSRTITAAMAVPPAHNDPVDRVQRAEAWLRQLPADGRNVNQEPQQLMPPTAAEAGLLEQMQHEDLIMEISELIHRQLVTSTLDSSYRNVLERQMRNRLEGSGTDGQQVLQYLRQLPRTAVHQRNDFRDLGIDTTARADSADDISVISATAAVSLPHAYTQSTAALSQEMRQLKSQVTELKNMLQLSFDLQLDIQRSIRQEVSAAISAEVGGSGRLATASASVSTTNSDPSTSSSNCLICLDKPVDTVIYQCGHMCLCYNCAMQLRRRSGTHCPVCRAPIRDIVRVYRPN